MSIKLISSQRIVDERNRIVMAEGRMTLLEHIVQTGSINQAAKRMNMSYKSAWSKIRSTEKHLGARIVHSDKASGTRLTATGEALMRRYRLLKQRCLKADDAVFESIFRQSDDASIDPESSGDIARHKPAVPPIVSIVGYSGSGKTTFLEKLVAVLTARGIKVAIVKHDVHGFEMDRPGKDTWRHRQAGAVATIISSATQVGLVMDADHDHLPEELAAFVAFADIIITEGYKRGPYPKLEIFRPAATGDKAPVCTGDPQFLALVTDESVSAATEVFGLDQVRAVADFLINRFELQAP